MTFIDIQAHHEEVGVYAHRVLSCEQTDIHQKWLQVVMQWIDSLTQRVKINSIPR